MVDIIFVNMVDPYNIVLEQTPLGLISLYTIVNQNGIPAEICDLNYMYYTGKIKRMNRFKDNIDEIKKHILLKKPKIVSIYSMCNTFHMALIVGERIKRESLETKLILAGPHATLVAGEALEEFPFVDYVGMGEGENTILGNIKGILNNKEIFFDGIAYRNKLKEIVIKWDRRKRIDINCLDIYDIFKFNDLNILDNIVSIEGGRGCPFHCAFCSTQNFWGNIFQVKNIDKMINEIFFYYKKYNITNFSIQHDLFTLNKEYILIFCKELKKLQITDLNWACSSRIDVIDREMIHSMAEAGCNNIFYGIESGSPKIQNLIHKNLEMNKIKEIIEEMVENGVNGIFSFIYGFPEETENELNQTMLLAYNIKRLYNRDSELTATFNITCLNFLPGTEFGNKYYDELIYNRLDGMSYYNDEAIEPIIEEIIKKHKRVFLHCYNLPQNTSEEMKYFGYFFMIIFNNHNNQNSKLFDELISQYRYNFINCFLDIFKLFKRDIVWLCNSTYSIKNTKQKVKNNKVKKILCKMLAKY